MFQRSFLDEIIYEKQKEAYIEKALSTFYSRKTYHDARFKYGGLKYIKSIESVRDGNKLIDDLVLLSYIEENY